MNKKKKAHRGVRLFAFVFALAVIAVIVYLIVSALTPKQKQHDTIDMAELSDEDFAAFPVGEPISERVKNITPPQPTYLYSQSVPFRPAVNDSYFDDALFIGDSLTNGLELFGSLKNAKYLCVTSASVYSTLAAPELSQTLSSQSFGKVYILLGINEMSASHENFAARYAELVEFIRSYQPQAHIYIETILPVQPDMTRDASIFSVENVRSANDALRKIAEDKEVFLIDTHSAYADENDRMPAEQCRDGVHMHPEYYEIWCDYLRTHAIPD